MRSATDVLRDEHRVILAALAALERAVERPGAAGPPPAGWWERMLDWLSAFADRNHHAKEERGLFPAMVKAGVPGEHGPIAVMLEEHERGRALLRAVTAADGAGRVAPVREYVRLLRDHIDKENGVLFPLAESVLDERAAAAVAREFEGVALEHGRLASIDRAEAALAALEAALG